MLAMRLCRREKILPLWRLLSQNSLEPQLDLDSFRDNSIIQRW